MNPLPSPSRRPARGRFRPPHCPNPDCPFHLPDPHWHVIRIGSRLRASDHRRIPRFRCVTCRRTFSSATFRPTYWLRYRHLLAPIARLSVAGSGLRQIARTLGISHNTVSRHLARAARHALLFHLDLTRAHSLTEPLAADGFETFEFSQYFPCHYNIAVGTDSWFIYFFNDSPLRRKGRMTPEQKLRRAELEARFGRPDPKALENAMAELVGEVVRSVPVRGRLELRTDEHPAYPRALRRTRGVITPIDHRTTPSRAARTARNPLFAVNALDVFLRHSQANHRRETIAFNKRRQGGLERFAVYLLWRNTIKKYHENGDLETPAMRAGLLDRFLSWREIFRHRRFPAHRRVPESWRRYYWRQVKTVALEDRQVVHQAKYAF